MPGQLLALDLGSQKLGWALGPVDTARPRSGTLRLPQRGEEIGAMLREMHQWLVPFIKSAEPEVCHMAVEAAMPAHAAIRKGNREITLRKLWALAAHADFVAAALAIPYSEDPVQTVRRHFCGHGRPDKPKQAVMHACHLRGWEPADDNAADALALWDYTRAKRWPKHGRKFAVQSL